MNHTALSKLRQEWRAVARHGLAVLAISAFMAWLAWLSGRPRTLDVQLVYTCAISMISWAAIDIGRFFVGQEHPGGFPAGWRRPALVLAGIVGGYVLGTVIGDWYCGQSTWELIWKSPRTFAALTLGSLFVGLGFSYYYYSRGALQYHKARVEEMQRLAAETQLKLLESQLEPHMLFNTLANLRVLIALDPPRAQAMLDHLISFLRATLRSSRTGEQTLRMEFDRLADYLELMHIRMGERLSTHLDLPDELAASAIPPLLLQPLVENAIKHGLEPCVAGGRIEVRARRQAQSLVLEVRDTGMGLGPTLGQAPTDGAGTGFGVEQVRQRLAATYGTAASLALTPAQDEFGGTLATIRILRPS